MTKTLRSLLAVVALAAATLVLAISSPVSAGADPAPGVFTSVPATNLMWTQTGLGGARFAANDTRTLPVTGVAGVPAASEVEAVSLLVVASDTGGAGALYVDEDGTSPSIPRVNVQGAGRTRSVAANVAPSAAGNVTVQATVAMDVGVVVQGWFPKGGGYHALDPHVVMDTATGLGGARLTANTGRDLVLAGAGGVPSEGVRAVDLRLTAGPPSGAGDVLVRPKGIAATGPSVALMSSLVTDTSSTVTGLGVDGAVTFTVTAHSHLKVTVDGWFDTAYVPTAPVHAQAWTAVTPATPKNVTIAGVGGVPTSGVGSVALVVLAKNGTGTAPESVKVQPGTGAAHTSSVLRATSPDKQQSGVLWTPLAADGRVQVQVTGDATASASVQVDVVGWSPYSATPTDSSAPTGSFASPTPGSSVDARDTGSFRVAIDAADAGSGVASVEVIAGGVHYPASRQVSGTAYRWVADVPATASGSQSYQAVIADRAGNTSTVAASYVLDVPEPDAPLVTPAYRAVDPSTLAASSVGAGSIQFNGDVRTSVHVGQVLASDPTALASKGYLRKVTGVRLVGGNTVVTTSQAALTDAVRQLHLDATVPAPAPSSGRGTGDEHGGTTNSLGFEGEVGVAYSHAFSIALSAGEPGSSPSVTGTLTAAGSLTASVKLDIGMDWDSLSPRVNLFETTLQASAGLNLSLVAEAGVAHEIDLPGFADIPLTPFPTPILGVMITPEIEITAKANAAITGHAEATLSTGKRYILGFRYEGGEPELIHESSTMGGGFDVVQSGTVGFDASVSAGARLNVLVDDTAGPYVEATAELGVHGKVDTDGGAACTVDLALNVAAGLDLEVPVIGLELADVEIANNRVSHETLHTTPCADGEHKTGTIDGTGTAWPDEKDLVSATEAGQPGNGGSAAGISSPGGNIVVFSSWATDLVSPAPGVTPQVYMRNMTTGAMSVVSRSSAGVAANDTSDPVDISPNGKRILFKSDATNLDPAATTPEGRMYMRNLDTNQTTAVVPTGCEAGPLQGDVMSDDGRYVMFHSGSPTCVPGDTNGQSDVFVRDTVNETTERVSVDSGGGQLAVGSSAGEMSGDGRYVTFESNTGQIDPAIAGPNGIAAGEGRRVFRHDRATGDTIALAVTKSGFAPRAMSETAMDSSGTTFFGHDPFATGYRSPMAVLDLSAGAPVTEFYDDPTIFTVSSLSPGMSDDGEHVSWRGPHGGLFIQKRGTDVADGCDVPGGSVLSGNAKFGIASNASWPGSPPNQVVRTFCRP